jgi:hypothetical protein
VRPPNKNEREWFSKGEYKHILRPAAQTPNSDCCIIQDANGKENRYDKIFRDDCKQQHIFRDAALPTLENVFKGYCGAIMAYGQTGTGKTHTMQGYDKTSEGDERGIIPRAADYIFSRAQKETAYKFEISLSMVQIYLDKLQDLFAPEAPELNITPDTERVEMPGLTTKFVTTTSEFMKLFYLGESHRVTRATLMNPTSSRGHAALVCNVRMEPNDPSMSTKVGKLVLVDLAGYERFALTGITTGIAAEEAKKINASLLALGAVVNGLADKQKHVPYRNSKLTRLLRDCLGGTSKSTIVLTIGPCDKYKQETAGTLYFGFRAMAVKVDARIKEEYDPTKYIANLKEKLGECGKTMQKMVKFMKDKGIYDEYTEKNGVPEIPDCPDDDDDDEEMEIVAALTRQPSKKMSMKIADAQERGEAVPVSAMTASDMLADAVDESLPENVRKVQADWNIEVQAHQQAAEKELEMLRLRHLQDLEEAKNAGVSEAQLAKLRQDHEDELAMMKEQNQMLRNEILRQKAKEEAQALLSSAVSGMNEEGTGLAGAGAGAQDQGRIGEMVNHLQETCESKDEVLVRLFDLICLRESEVRDLEQNMGAIAAAMAPADASDGTALKMENDRLKQEIARKDQHIEALKGLINVQQQPAAGGGVRPVQATTAARPVARPVAGSTATTRIPAAGGAVRPSAGYSAAPATRAAPVARPAGAPLTRPAAPGGYSRY